MASGDGRRLDLVVISHTHWDREWYQPFQVFRGRLVDLIDQLLAILDSEAEYRHFTLDGQTVVLEDYLELRPERRAELEGHVRSGRILVGPWYVLPDEFLEGPEALVRNLLVGRRLAREFGGGMDVGYLPDQFGHVGQMPQLLRLAGIDSAVLWRGVRPELAGREFLWRAPDGSEVLVVHLLNGYFNASRAPSDPERLQKLLDSGLGQLAERSASGVLPLMNGSDHVFPQPDLPRIMAAVARLRPNDAVIHGTLPMLVAMVRERLGGRELPVHAGELRDSQLAPVLPGTLSSRMWLKQRNAACERLLTRWAEPHLAWTALAGLEPDHLAARRAGLRRAWQYLLQNHAHDSICGCSVEEVHAEMATRFAWVEQIGEQVATSALRNLAEAVNTGALGGGLAAGAVVVFNAVSGPRRDFATFRVRVPVGAGVKVLEQDGGERPVQVLSAKPAAPQAENTSGEALSDILDLAAGAKAEEVEVGFLATDQAGYGCRAYGVAVWPDARLGPAKESWPVPGASIDNEFFLVNARPDGVFDLVEKANGRSWRGLGLLVDGADAGDEYNYSPPARDETVAGAAEPVRTLVVENGPARWTLESRGSLRLPARLADDRQGRSTERVACPFIIRASLYPGVRRVDFNLTLDNRAADHRLRAYFPLGTKVEGAVVEGHFELVERPARPLGGGPDWIEQPLPTHPHQGLVLAGGLAVASPGLPEYAIEAADGGSAIAVTLLRCVGWLSRDDLTTRKGHAGPGLPTPGAQCLGTSEFALAVFPHEGGPEAALAEAWRFATPLRAQTTGLHAGALPPEAALVRAVPAELPVTAIKLPEDGEGLVVRVFNPTPHPLSAGLEVAWPTPRAELVDLEERTLGSLSVNGGRVALALQPWQIATVRLSRGQGGEGGAR